MDPKGDLRLFLRAIREAWPPERSDQLGLVYAGPADFVLREGRWWVPVPRPFGIPRGVMGACYGNALGIAVLYGLRYVQGYAVHPLSVGREIAVPHAWNADADGNAVDVTWPAPGRAYLGVEMSPERADDGTWHGDADPIDDFRRDWPLLRQRWRGELAEPDPSWEPSPMLLAMRARVAGDEDEARRLYRLGLEEVPR